MKCFYHKSDLDGHCSGAIVLKRFPECEMIGVDYKDRASTIEPGERIFIVDFSFPEEDMNYLNETGLLTWIDHHKSAINSLSHLEIDGLREVGRAGCELAWEHLFEKEALPYAVFLLGRYDVWDHINPETLPFQSGMRAYKDTTPNNIIWGSLLQAKDSHPILTKVMVSGQRILDYQDKENATYVKGMSYEVEFEGLRAIVVNKAYTNSKIFDSVYDPDKHDIMIIFGVKPGDIKYSLYCDKPEHDVSKIAIKYGGGGHAGAAGFYSKTLLL